MLSLLLSSKHNDKARKVEKCIPNMRESAVQYSGIKFKCVCVGGMEKLCWHLIRKQIMLFVLFVIEFIRQLKFIVTHTQCHSFHTNRNPLSAPSHHKLQETLCFFYLFVCYNNKLTFQWPEIKKTNFFNSTLKRWVFSRLVK